MSLQGGLGDKEYSAQLFDGRQIKVVLQPNVKRAVGMDDLLILPQDFRWSPVGDSGQVRLVEDPGQFQKHASALRKFASVTVRSVGNHFDFEGLPLTKLAKEDRTSLSYDDSVFLLAGLGTAAEYGSTKLAEAVAFDRPVEIRVGRHIIPLSDSMNESKKVAEHLVARIPCLRVDLTKEAAFIPDPTAVDTILSLGFINPENIQTFIRYLPRLEDTESKLCELLISARLGARDLPVGALEKTVRTLEDVIQGLKTMSFAAKAA